MSESPFYKRIRAKTARIEFPIGQPTPLETNGQKDPRGSFGPKMISSAPMPAQAVFSSQCHLVQHLSPRSTTRQAHRFPMPLNPKLKILKTTSSAKNSKANAEQDRVPVRPMHTLNTAKTTCSPNNFNTAVVASNQLEVQRSTVEQIVPETADSLHLENIGLKQFPILSQNERQIRLLSLRNNAICRLQNLIVLNNLIVLDLYGNKIERISNLDAFQNLRVLLLGKNRIQRMEGFESLGQLEVLDLHANQLRYLDNLRRLHSLRILNLAGNAIRSIRNFGPSDMSSLIELNLKRNRLRSLNGLEKAVNLKKLLVSNNELSSISSLHPLGKLNLEELLLDSNPVCSIDHYKYAVLSCLPLLKILDRQIVTDGMKQQAKNWQQRQDSEGSSTESLKLEIDIPTVTESRDDVINQVRRRWESAIHFVKSGSGVAVRTKPKPGQSFCSETYAQYDYSEPVCEPKVLSVTHAGTLMPQLTMGEVPNVTLEDKKDSSNFVLKLPKVAIVRPRVRKQLEQELGGQLTEPRSTQMEPLSEFDASFAVSTNFEQKLLRNSIVFQTLPELCQTFDQKPHSESGVENSTEQTTDDIGITTNSHHITKCRPELRRSASVDTSLQNCTVLNTLPPESPRTRRNSSSRCAFARKQKNRVQTAKTFATHSLSSPNLSGLRRPLTGIREREVEGIKPLKRISSLSSVSPEDQPMQKQGSDYLVEIEGKSLNVFGPGSLKYFLMCFPKSTAETVETIRFHFVTFDSMGSQFVNVRQVYPAAENFQFKANNISTLAQLNALADLQGVTCLEIHPDGNPIVDNPLWISYTKFRLGHWGLKTVNGSEVIEMSGCQKGVFDPLGYLALSCLPQSTLSPLAKKLHALQTFCCCSQSSSSEDSGRNRSGGGSDNSSDVCNAWDNDPVLLDVIGKEAFVYALPQVECSGYDAGQLALNVVRQGEEMLRKLESLENFLPEIVQRAIEDILVDYYCMDNYMKKELKKVSKLG